MTLKLDRYTWDTVIQKIRDEQRYVMLDVHLTAPFRILRAAQPVIRALSKVVKVSSVTDLFGNAGQTNYSAATAAI